VDKKEFNPKRLTLAREKRGLTKVKLASATNVSTKSITEYESGRTVPTPENISALSEALTFPVEFFFANDPDVLAADAASFRSQKSMTASQRDSALAASSLAIDLIDWIDKNFALPPCKLMDLRDYNPESAASELRTQWGLGERPVSNAIHILEANGVRVFSLVEDCRQVDAFSFWRANVPFVFLNTMKSGERSRFDAMHELGHLVLHRHGGPGGRVAEQEADRFASAMLMPRGDIIAHAPAFPTLDALINAKFRWTVAVSALNHRLHSLGIITDWHYRTLCIQISERGYRINEPNGCQRETSKLLQKIFASLKDEGIMLSDVAKQLFISLEDIDSLVFRLLPLSRISGGNRSNGHIKSRSHLSIVPNVKK
jgi:Zn-dependent peptidase ImmA (M78 family)/DNA-binding XRE family transcriptional regulator